VNFLIQFLVRENGVTGAHDDRYFSDSMFVRFISGFRDGAVVACLK
jgi:hypothetical protein